MSERMTDERLDEIGDAFGKWSIFDNELYKALKAERARNKELEAMLDEVVAGITEIVGENQ